MAVRQCQFDVVVVAGGIAGGIDLHGPIARVVEVVALVVQARVPKVCAALVGQNPTLDAARFAVVENDVADIPIREPLRTGRRDSS